MLTENGVISVKNEAKEVFIPIVDYLCQDDISKCFVAILYIMRL